MLCYLFWDPSREILKLPFLPMPIVWYGLLFALGFYLGYRIMVYILMRELLLKPEFRSCDIHWALLEKRVSDPASELSRLVGGNWGKEKTIERLNQVLAQIESKERSALNSFFSKRVTLSLMQKIRGRLYLERHFPECFISIKERATKIVDSLTTYIVLATLIGARLGHIVFYEHLSFYLKNPLLIFKTWEGGLASHGALVVIILFLVRFIKTKKEALHNMNGLFFLDLLVIPTCLVGALIRIGNFVNQEILGRATTLPWAVIFGNPADGGAIVPRHPVQLYEAFFYFATFILLFSLWKGRFGKREKGLFSGLFFVLVFGFRFVVEFLKVPQSKLITSDSHLLMGQILSVPVILLGSYLLFRIVRAKRHKGKLFSDEVF